MRRRIVKWGCLIPLAVVGVLVVIAGAVIFYQGRQTPTGEPSYVALGSSYAAGAGLGSLQPGSPLLCARSVNGYPQQLARDLALSIVDMSCGGAVTANLIDGGQWFQGAQIRVIDRRTRLVTITAGGNDVGFVGDMSMGALRKTGTMLGWLADRFGGVPKPAAQRDFAKLHRELVALIREIHRRAPEAVVIVASYPRVLPSAGTCPQIKLTVAEVDLLRGVEQTLAATTAAAAKEGGATLVDMNAIGAGHDACSADPWTHGWSAFGDAPFHPTLAGAKATARAIADALRRSPAGVAAIR
jgi:lysophospholipase L1-like esterase